MNFRYSVSKEQYIYWSAEIARERVRSKKQTMIGYFLLLISMVLIMKMSSGLSNQINSESKIYLWSLLGSFFGFLVGLFTVLLSLRKMGIPLHIGPDGIQYELQLGDEDVILKTGDYTLVYPWSSYIGTARVRDAYLLQFRPCGGIGIPVSTIADNKENLDQLLNAKNPLTSRSS